MKYTLEENAVDTLKCAMAYFDAYANKSDCYLKYTILFLENAIELFLKLILIGQDEECIYTIKSKELIHQGKNYLLTHPDCSLAEYLIDNLDVKTITYSEAVSKYCSIFWSENPIVKDKLLLLSKYRNAIHHFGIDTSSSLDKLVCCVYEVFQLITDYMYGHLLNASEYFGFSDCLDIIEPVVEGGIDYLRQMCVDNPNNNIQPFITAFQSAFSSDSFIQYLQANTLDITDCKMDYKSNDYEVRIGGLSNYALCVDSWYSTFYNATIFTDESGGLYFAIEHTQNMIYILKNSIHYPHFGEAEEYYVWRREAELDNAEKMDITTDNLIYAIMKAVEVYSN